LLVPALLRAQLSRSAAVPFTRPLPVPQPDARQSSPLHGARNGHGRQEDLLIAPSPCPRCLHPAEGEAAAAAAARAWETDGTRKESTYTRQTRGHSQRMQEKGKGGENKAK
jgi:hypothetical protein